MRILKNVSTHCYMLESAQANETWGRYTFLGFDPKLEITCLDGEMRIGNLKVKTDHPSDYLRQILAEYKSPRLESLPSFTGGLVGYFCFGSGKTQREVAEYFGFRDKYVVKSLVKRERAKQRKREAGITIRPKGRPRKAASPRDIVAEQAYEIRRLRMENELLRDFLRSTGRK